MRALLFQPESPSSDTIAAFGATRTMLLLSRPDYSNDDQASKRSKDFFQPFEPRSLQPFHDYHVQTSKPLNVKCRLSGS